MRSPVERDAMSCLKKSKLMERAEQSLREGRLEGIIDAPKSGRWGKGVFHATGNAVLSHARSVWPIAARDEGVHPHPATPEWLGGCCNRTQRGCTSGGRGCRPGNGGGRGGRGNEWVKWVAEVTAAKAFI